MLVAGEPLMVNGGGGGGGGGVLTFETTASGEPPPHADSIKINVPLIQVARKRDFKFNII